MPKVNHKPDPNRRQTRATNANAHLGNVVKEVLAVRRKPDDIEREKKDKAERRKARETKNAVDRVAIDDIANFENQMALEDRVQETKFPRHQTEVNALTESQKRNKKRKGPTTKPSDNTISENNKTITKAYQRDSVGFDTDVEIEDVAIEDDLHKLKKQKAMTSQWRAVPLRRNETHIRAEDFVGQSLVNVPIQDASEVMEFDDDTPTPKQKRKVITDSENEDASSQAKSVDDFETPMALKRKVSVALSDNFDLANVDVINQDEASEYEHIRKGDDSDNNWQREWKSDRTKANANVQKVPGFKTIDLTKVQKNATRAKDKRAFCKEIENRWVVVKEERDKQEFGSYLDPASQDMSSLSDSSKIVKNHTERNVTSSHHLNPKPMRDKAHLYKKSCGSSGSSVSIVQSADTSERKSKPNATNHFKLRSSRGKLTGLKPKPNPATETVVNLEDEDDTAERESILQSPPKGTKRLSSGAIVKVETGGNEGRKSRSRKNILSPDILSGWTRFVEPNFIYFYFYELSPWPTTGTIATCAQILWDWRFGDAHSCDFSKGPAHVQLLNQKLCDIRNQSASSAITNLDLEFRLQLAAKDFDLLLDVETMMELRQEHAQDLFQDKKFMFRKYAVSQGTVCKSRPYQSKIILRTFASLLKHIKDVDLSCDDETDGPLPSSRFPQTLLSITTAAVEHALELTIKNDYDFNANKFIPKPDPSHPMQKLTTSMFAFSETAWEPRVEFYLKKSILKLKEKDWESIMNAATEYSNIRLKPSPSKRKGKGKSRVQATEEELELEYASDSDEMD